MDGTAVAGMPAGTPEPERPRTRGLIIGLGVAAAVLIVALAATAIAIGKSSGDDANTTASAQTYGTESSETLSAAADSGDETQTSITEIEPPTTVALQPEKPIFRFGVDDPDDSAGVIQGLATALAGGDWNKARAIWPDLSKSDPELQGNYGALDKSTVVITAVDGNVVHGAYLAWNTVEAAPQTSIYCAAWTVDSQSRQVTHADGGQTSKIADAWEIPEDAADQVTAVCP